MKVSIVIPNYNGEVLLRRNLPQLISVLQDYAKKKKEVVEIVINDDGSTDNSRELLKEYSEKEIDSISFVTLSNGKNYGFSTTVNRGVEKATGEIVVLLNTDVLPDKGFLEPLLEHFSDEKVFAVGCMDKSVEPHGTELRGRGVGSWERGFLVHNRGELNKTNTLWVSGGSGAFRKSIWDKIGGLNELMNPFYWEDIDLSYRALKADYTLVFEKRSTVVHEHEEGVIKKSSSADKVKMTAYRNQFYFVWINISESSLLLNHLLWLPVHIINALRRKDMLFIRGLVMALSHFSSVQKKRRSVQELVKVSDRAIFSSFSS